jgi:hypothetical protein
VPALAEKLWTIAFDHNGKDTATLPDLDGQEAAAIASEAIRSVIEAEFLGAA